MFEGVILAFGRDEIDIKLVSAPVVTDRLLQPRWDSFTTVNRFVSLTLGSRKRWGWENLVSYSERVGFQKFHQISSPAGASHATASIAKYPDPWR